MMYNIDDFLKTYYNSFKELYNVSENELKDLYFEDIYSGHPITPEGSAWDSEMKSLYCAIRLKKPKNILEIGNWKGYSTNHILFAAEKNNNNSNIVLVDIEENLDYKNLHNNKFTRFLSDSILLLQKKDKLNFDFIAQDGCHVYEYVKKELEIILEKTNIELDIWSHDYFAPKSHGAFCNVKQAWDETKDHKQIKYFFPLVDSVSNCGIVLGRIVPHE